MKKINGFTEEELGKMGEEFEHKKHALPIDLQKHANVIWELNKVLLEFAGKYELDRHEVASILRWLEAPIDGRS